MSLKKSRLLLLFIFLLAGCSLGSSSLPQSVTQSQAAGSQRTQYIWDKALEGMAMGGSLAGPYGAGGGLVLGLLAGLFTADAHYAQVNNQIQSEQTKDRELEAKIEQEMQRQRELEAQLANSVGIPAQQNQAEPAQSSQKPAAPKVMTVAAREAPNTVASVSSKENTRSSPPSTFKNVEVKDINGDGIPDLWIYYNPLMPSEIVRQEEATHWDGRVDTWSYFKDGKLVRREVDTKGKGTADLFYSYDNDKIVREERDENGTGQVSYRATYQNGRRAKVEKETNGGGKTDFWIYYDTTKDGEIVLKEEWDLNGDGAVDLWSYYENGRLVRRDLSAVGLELLNKGNQLPSSPSDPRQTSTPELVRGDKGHSWGDRQSF